MLKKIYKKKDEGSLTPYAFVFMVLIVVGALCAFLMRKHITTSARIKVEDALTNACLAAGEVDTDIYPNESWRIVNYDYTLMYEKFLRHLKANLKLNDSMEQENSAYMCSPVKVEEFWVYNIDRDSENKVVSETLRKYIKDGAYNSLDNERQIVYALNDHPNRPTYYTNTPNGSTVTSLTVYAKISFEIQGLFGVNARVYKHQAIDVVAYRY